MSIPPFLIMDPLITPTNQPILHPAILTLNHSIISCDDQLSSSDYHSFSSRDPSEDPLNTDHQPASFMIKSQNERVLLDIHASSSSVPFKWEEAPGKPIPTSAQLEMDNSSDNFPYSNSPLQLPPKLQHQAHHTGLLLQSPCRVDDCWADGLPATIDHQYSLRKVENPYRNRPLDHSLSRRLRLLHLSSPFAESSAFPQSPYVFPQKLKKVCTSFLRSASWSRQPLHKLAPPCSGFTCYGSSEEDSEKEKEVTNYDRFFFDINCHKGFSHSTASMADSSTSFDHESKRHFLALPIFDKSQREESSVSRDVLRFLAMEEYQADSIASSSPCQPILVHERQGSGLFSCPPASIMNLHDTDNDDCEGFHDFFSPRSSLHAISQRIEDAETSASLTPLPWFLDFSPNEEEKHHVVNKGSNKMSLVRLLALIKIKSTVSNKVCKIKRRGGREGALFNSQEKSMWSPTLATYFYDSLHKKEAPMKNIQSNQPPHYVSEHEQPNLDEEGPLRINYHLPTIIKGHLISNHYYLDDDLVSPHQAISLTATSSCSSLSSVHDEKNLRKAIHRLSLREQLAQLNDEHACPEQTTDHPANGSLKERDCALAYCKGLCKLKKTVQVLATSIKLIGVKFDDKEKGTKRPYLSHRSSVNSIFPLQSPRK